MTFPVPGNNDNVLPLPLREGVGRRGPWGWSRPLPPTPSHKGRGRLLP